MLEIIGIIGLTRAIGRLLDAKGRKSGWYRLLAVVLWFGGEIVGFIIGAQIGKGPAAYGFAILGAGVGALIAYLIAKSAAPMNARTPPTTSARDTF